MRQNHKKIRSVFFVLFLFATMLSACKKTPIPAGTYEYNCEYCDAPAYIVITNKNDKIQGYYYGSSDDFDDAREGYEAGFFSAQMKNIRIENQTVLFDIKPEKYFVKAVSPLVKQSDFTPWTTVSANWKNKTYKASYKDNKITLKLKGLDDRIFVKIK